MNVQKYDPSFVEFFDWVSDKKRAELIVHAVQSISYQQTGLWIKCEILGTLEEVLNELSSEILSCIELTPSLKNLLLNFIKSNGTVDALKLISEGKSVFLLNVDKFTNNLFFSADSPSQESIKFTVEMSYMNDSQFWSIEFSGIHLARLADSGILRILESSYLESYFHSWCKDKGSIESSSKSIPPPPPKTPQSPHTPITTTQKRGAVYDTVDVNIPYHPKEFPKDENINNFLAKVVKNTILFRSFSLEEYIAVVRAFERTSVSTNEIIIKQGDPGEFFYVIESGRVDIYLETGGTKVIKIGKSLAMGDYFGELALMYNTPRAATVVAAEPTVLWRIDRQTYRMIITHHKKTHSEERLELLRNVEILGKRLGDVLSSNQLSKVVASLEEDYFEPGSVIIRQNQTGDYFYIIKHGNVEVWQKKTGDLSVFGHKIADLGRGAYFGEKALLADDVRQASCIAVDKVVCLSLSREDFIAMLGSWQDLTDTKESGVPLNNRRSSTAMGSIPEARFMSLALEELEQLCTIGMGAFGRLKLARHRETGETFALKCQSKKAIVDLKVQGTVLNEMHLMRLVDHPCITKLYCALQDSKYIYFVLELLQGGDFFGYLQREGKLNEDRARFYTASVVAALKALHAKKIAFRDLKPENMVLDSRGYVKLVDLGLAKQIISGHTWTICGTPDYLAPEIIMNQGHNIAVDYWALGVLLFEMINGWSPFYSEDPMKIYERIISSQVTFPPIFSKQLADLTSKLLQKNPSKRLGNVRGGVVDIMKHRWFGSFDWQGLEQGIIQPEYVPCVKGPMDIGNFETFPDEEDVPEECDWNPDLS